MKIKLIEAVTPMIKLERNIIKHIVPTMEKLGYDFNLSRTLKEKYIYTFFGTYTGTDNLKIPFELILNTSSPRLDDPYQMFATIKMGGHVYDLGSCSSTETKEFEKLIRTTITNPEEDLSKYNAKSYITSKNGKEKHTKEEWIKLFKKNRDSMEPRQFGDWWNNVYPDGFGR